MRKRVTQPIEEPPLDDPDILPDSTKMHGPCNRCGRVSNFTLHGSAPVTFRKDGSYAVGHNGPQRLYDQQLSILECNGCRDCVVVIEDQYVGGRRGGRGGEVHFRGFFWWPSRGAGALGDGVSAKVAAAYDEGVRCLSAGAPNGAVAMLRTALTYMGEEHG